MSDREKHPEDPQAQSEPPTVEDPGTPETPSPVEPDPNVQAPELVAVRESFEGIKAPKGKQTDESS